MHGEGTERGRAGAGADHEQCRGRVIRHQEGRTERSANSNGITLLQVAEVVRTEPLRLALDRQSKIVGVGPLSVAGTCDGIKPHLVWSAVRVVARRHDADRLAFKNWKVGGGEIKDNVACIAFGVLVRQTVVALDAGDRGFLACEQVDRRLRGRRRRHRPTADAGVGLGKQSLDLIIEGFDDIRCSRRRTAAFGEFFLFGEFVPGELIFQRVGACDDAPVVDRARRAWRDAVHAEVTLLEIHDDIVVVMRDRVDRALLLAGVAANADFRVDQMLFVHCLAHGAVRSLRGRAAARRVAFAPGDCAADRNCICRRVLSQSSRAVVLRHCKAEHIRSCPACRRCRRGAVRSSRHTCRLPIPAS